MPPLSLASPILEVDRRLARLSGGIGGSSRWTRFYHGNVTRPRLRVAAALLAAVTLAACTRGETTPSASDTAATNAKTAPLLPATVDALPTMDPQGFDDLLAQLRGTPLIVNFWASWCLPCKEETPLLVHAHRLHGRRVQFLGVDILDSREGATRFLSEQGVGYPSVFDPGNAIGISRDLFAPPVTLFYAADGTLVATVPGQLSARDLRANLQAIAG